MIKSNFLNAKVSVQNKSKKLFYPVLMVCGLAVLGASLFVYINRFTKFKLPSGGSIQPRGKPVTITGTSVSIKPEDPDKAGLTAYPDLPLAFVPEESVSVKFVVEHRSGLNGKLVKVRGVIVDAFLGERACPPDYGMCGQPRIFLADTIRENRNKFYDLTVIVGEEKENDYSVGEIVEIQGTVEGSKVAVIVRKN